MAQVLGCWALTFPGGGLQVKAELGGNARRRWPKAALRHCIALALTYHRSGAKDYL
jgi:hypothetical protein